MHVTCYNLKIQSMCNNSQYSYPVTTISDHVILANCLTNYNAFECTSAVSERMNLDLCLLTLMLVMALFCL